MVARVCQAVLSAALCCATALGQDGLEARVAAAVERAAPDLWGCVLVATDGEVRVARGYGQRDPDGAPVDADSLFDLGGLSDRITVAAALRLLDQKRWKLDDPITRRVPKWPKDKAAITWRHLIEHTSGLPGNVDFGAGIDNRRQAMQAIAEVALIDAPGDAVHWSIVNANLLGMLVEQCGGRDYADYVDKRLLRPAGMKTAVFVGDPRLEELPVTWRPRPDGGPAPASDQPWNWGQRGARGLLASANDLSALAAALLSGDLLDPEWRAVLLQPFDGGGVLRVQQAVRGGVTWTQLHGAATGYRARLLLQPDARAWIVLLCGERNLDELEAAVAAATAPSLPAAVVTGAAAPAVDPGPGPAPAPAVAPPPPVAVTDEQLARFLGVFELPSGGRFEVHRDGAGLRVEGIGLMASVHIGFGQWPVEGYDEVLRRCEDRGMAGLEPLVLGTGEPPKTCFSNAPAITAAKRAIDAVRPLLGSRVALRFVGTQLRPSPLSWLRLEGDLATVMLRVGWTRKGEIAQVAEATEPQPFVARFQVPRADWAVGRVGKTALTMSVEGRGAGRVLVFEDGSGLLECRWAADLR